jgi:hypothetical protein
MELKDIISISGAPGLYKVVAPSKGGFIIESLIDGKRTSISAAGTQPPSFLAEVGIYTTDEEMPLAQVFKKMKEQEGTVVDPKGDEKALKAYFKTVVPTFDEERVYPSHIKKIINWFNLLKDKIDFTKIEENAEGDTKADVKGEPEKPIHKTHESHGPKTQEHGMARQVKTRKKV